MALTAEEVTLRDLILFVGLKRGKAIVLLSGGLSLWHEFDISPEDFLQQAEDDFELGGNNARLNALSNAKRAIHAQVDEVLLALGFTAVRANFSRKMELLADLGFVSPRMLRRVNDARNVLEHEYHAPTYEQVEEAIDLASLFVGATKRNLENWENDFSVGNEDEQLGDEAFSNEIIVEFDQEPKSFCVTGYRGIKLDPNLNGLPSRAGADERGPVRVAAGLPLFDDLVRLVLAARSERKTREVLDRLLLRLGI